MNGTAIPLEFFARRIQCSQAAQSFEAVAAVVSHNFAGILVHNQRQINKAVLKTNVR